MYQKQIQVPAKLVFNIIKKDCPNVLNQMFQHLRDTLPSKEDNKALLISMLRKLFLHKINAELSQAVWGLQTGLDATFRPFASKQQVLCPTA